MSQTLQAIRGMNDILPDEAELWEQFEELVRKNGGIPSDSVSKKTDYLVAGESPGSNLEKAKQNGVKRKFDKLEYQDARQWVNGYILVDVTHAPRIEYAVVPKDRVPESGPVKFSYEDATSLISLATSNTDLPRHVGF